MVQEPFSDILLAKQTLERVLVEVCKKELIGRLKSDSNKKGRNRN
jgi:hypothetical protein|tara:strand:- start:312 stop:446 length:135 start_codon:yes stop_codon:yes gene_type:complete